MSGHGLAKPIWPLCQKPMPQGAATFSRLISHVSAHNPGKLTFETNVPYRARRTDELEARCSAASGGCDGARMTKAISEPSFAGNRT